MCSPISVTRDESYFIKSEPKHFVHFISSNYKLVIQEAIIYPKLYILTQVCNY